jgi:hypothetical protein
LHLAHQGHHRRGGAKADSTSKRRSIKLLPIVSKLLQMTADCLILRTNIIYKDGSLCGSLFFFLYGWLVQ